jgi:membrane peptidoglycan carboxypeptidase
MQFSQICPDDYYDSSALGGLTYGTTTVEMAAAYATLENHGTYREATCLVSIKDHNGNELYESSDEIQVYASSAADTMVDMMKGVLTDGTAKKLDWYESTDTVAAGKTGTTNNSKDGWFCGFTKYYTVSVWVGFDTPRELEDLYGATYPGQIWKASMLSLIDGKTTVTDFETAEEELEAADTGVSANDAYGTLPASAYEDYLPGRDDSEILSSGYTVYDYRKDRLLGEDIDSIITRMCALDASSNDYHTMLSSLYTDGCSLVESIYSRKYSAQKQEDLDGVYDFLW